MSPCHVPEMQSLSSVHRMEEEPKKAERKVAMLYRAKSTPYAAKRMCRRSRCSGMLITGSSPLS